jgi:hypothetical protein
VKSGQLVRNDRVERNVVAPRAVNEGMSVLPTPGHSLVRVVALAVATTVAALMLLASLITG